MRLASFMRSEDRSTGPNIGPDGGGHELNIFSSNDIVNLKIKILLFI